MASNEFITKFKSKAEHNNQTPEDDRRFEVELEEANLSDNSDDKSDGKPNGEM